MCIAFVNFKKYFDMINRQFLYYQSMNDVCYYKIKCDVDFTESILSSIRG